MYFGKQSLKPGCKHTILLCAPYREGGGGYIVFGADPVCIGVDFRFLVSVHYLLNQSMDFDQTCTDTLLGGGEELIRFW